MKTFRSKSIRWFPAVAPLILVCVAAGPTGAETADPGACLDCHEETARMMDAGPHALATDGSATRVTCTACHAGRVDHYEDDAESFPMGIPGDGTVAETAALCAACHTSAHQENQATLSRHALNDVDCLDCHRIHGGEAPGLLVQVEPDLCFRCHGELQGEFARPYRHPAGSTELVKCSDCHLSTDDRLASLTMYGSTAPCLNCHGDMQGPFPYDHQATVDYSVQEGGCMNCHDPHGSYLPRLLTQPYEAPHFQLCSQCHAVPLHRYSTQHGSAWADVSCSECHIDIHGSYTNRLFATSALEAQGCFAAGCHTP